MKQRKVHWNAIESYVGYTKDSFYDRDEAIGVEDLIKFIMTEGGIFLNEKNCPDLEKIADILWPKDLNFEEWGYGHTHPKIDSLIAVYQDMLDKIKNKFFKGERLAIIEESRILMVIGNEGSRLLITEIYDYEDALEVLQKKKEEAEERRKRIKQAKEQRERKGLTYVKNVGGIYCARLNGKIIYIGKTKSPFEQRFQEHKDALHGKGTIQPWHRQFAQNADEIDFQVLIDRSKSDIVISDESLAVAEYTLIKFYQPEGNWKGVKVPYEDDDAIAQEDNWENNYPDWKGE